MHNVNNGRKNYYLIYTFCFLIMCAIVFSYYYLNGITFINHTNDGLVQHYKALIYYSEYLRTIFRNFFIEHSFEIPMWDFTIGEGADILQTLHMYAIGDPLSFFSVFFPRNLIYVYYDLSIIIRLYLAGLFFSILCFYTKRNNQYAVLAGTLVYVFCYWDLLNVNEHIYFLNPMLYLPLIVLGIEKIINDEKPYLLSVAVFISALSNFYFFYMLVVLTVLYVAVRLLFAYIKEPKKLLSKLITIIIFSAWGTALAAVILLPVIDPFMSDSRVSIESAGGLLYSRFYYERLFTVFVSNDFEYDLCMGFAAPTLLALGLLLKDKRKTGRMLLVYNIIVFLMVCIPYAGKVMNGFAYPINRWSFAIALVVAYSFVYEWEELQNNKKYLLIFMVVLFVGSMVSAWSRQIRVFVPIALCIIFYIVLNLNIDKKIKDLDLKQVLLILIVVFNIIYIADYDYSARGSNRKEDAATVEEALSEVYESDAERFAEFVKDDNDAFYRYSGNFLKANAGMLAGVKSTDFYWSVTNPNVISFRNKLGLLDLTSYMYRGYDDRSSLYILGNVKYFVDNEIEPIPYIFDYEGENKDKGIYQNRYTIPFGYTYETAVSYEKWDKLDQIEKQETLLNNIVLDVDSDLDPVYDDYRKKTKLVGDNGIVVDGNRITVSEEKSDLHIMIEDPDKGEYNLSFDNLQFEDTEGYIDGNRTILKIRTEANDVNKLMYFYTKEYQFYSGRHEFTICYGYNENGVDEIILTLPYPGVYTFDDLYVSRINNEMIQEQTDLLKEDVLEDVEFSVNRIDGNIDLKKDKYMLLSIPYANGWKAYVDGKEKELLRANECYMALSLEKGSHTIELRYNTPFLKFGSLVSMVSIIGFGVFWYLDRKNGILK
ncbi:MAG: YfhO family protein [Erysipelotrichaceae bacterium]|nr:YfhO family protein [Erysipelotrichaceae bacterium]